MKRALLALLLIVCVVGLAAVIGVAIARDSGYVLISYRSFRYESSVWATIALVLAVWLIVALLRWAIRLLMASGGVVNPWSRHNRSRRVQRAIERGQLDLAEGRWASAQRHLQRAAEAEQQPLLYYLGAARAANEQGLYEESDALLARALARQPHAELAIALNHAQLQVDRGDTDGALVALEVMHGRHPHNSQVLRQLQRLYLQRGDWPQLVKLLPELRKNKVLTDEQLGDLERRAWTQNLNVAGQQSATGDAALPALEGAWAQLTGAQRNESALVLAYAEQLRQLGAQVQAEEVLQSALKRRYDSHLARFYGLVRGKDQARQLQIAEGWLREHAQDPSLLLTLGRLSAQNSLWGKARDYFESSLKLERNPETCAELARLLAQLGETERSNQLFQEGLGLLDRRLLASPLPQLMKV